jgi:hypothetical protein
MGSGLYRRDQAMGEGESLWSLIDHQMEQIVEQLEVPEFCKQRNKQGKQLGEFGKQS